MEEGVLFRSDLQHLLENRAFRALVEDLKERKQNCHERLGRTLLSSPETVAKANMMVGQIEEIEYIMAFPQLVLAEIDQREEEERIIKEKEKEGKENE